MARHILLFFSAFFLLLSSLHAQSSRGTSFWLGYLENIDLVFNDSPIFSILIDTDESTQGSISVPATGLSIPFTAAAGTVTEVELPDAIWYSQGSEIIDNKGILITTEKPVRASAFHYRAYFSESTHLLPEAELGTEYITSCYLDDRQNYPSSLVVVSAEEEHTIEITPSTLTQGLRPAGVPFTITLQRGQNFQLKAGGDLTGTYIRSLDDKKLAVFSGAQRAFIGNCFGGADSHVFEQALPIEQWGTLYHYIPFRGQGSDVLKVVAAEEDTRVFFDCEQVALLNRGEQYQVERSEPTVISSTAPVAVSQFNTSASCSPSGLGDPNMLRLLPAGHQAQQLRFFSAARFNPFISNDYFEIHFVNVVAKAEETAGITLDGASIAGEFSPLPGDPAYAYAQLPVTAGVHRLESEGYFQAYNYGFGNFDAYATHLGYDRVEEARFACLNIGVEGVFCVDSLLAFSYTSGVEMDSQLWELGNGNAAGTATASQAYSTPGVYNIILTTTDAEGNVFTDSLQVEIVDCADDPCQRDPGLSVSFNPEQGCVGQPVNFRLQSAVGLADIQWAFGNGQGGSGSEAQAIFGQAGTFDVQLTATDVFNCHFTLDTVIHVLDCGPCEPGEVELEFMGAPCVDSILAFPLPFDAGANPPLFVEWKVDGEAFGNVWPLEYIFESPGAYLLEFSAEDIFGCTYQGVLDLVIEDCSGSCSNLPPLDIAFGSDNFCTNALLEFTARSEANLVDYQWETNEGSLGSGPVFSAVFAEEGVGIVTLRAFDELGCAYFAELAFDLEDCSGGSCNDLPPLDIAVNGRPCVDSLLSAEVFTEAELTAYEWSFGNGGSSGLAEPFFSYEQPGLYTITVEAVDSLGCRYEESFSFDIERCLENCPLSFPNAFTPNGDGINDHFVPLFQCPPADYSLQVFNRWGELVFESQNPEEGWDGTYEGKAVPSDTFFWQLAYILDNGEGRRAAGDVSLLR